MIQDIIARARLALTPQASPDQATNRLVLKAMDTLQPARAIAKAQHHAPKGSTGPDGKPNGGQFTPTHDPKLLNHQVPSLPADCLSKMGKPDNAIKADCVKLHEKHPDMFPTPEDARAALDWTFSRPDAVYRAHGGPDHISVLRRGENNHHAVVDFGSKSGQFRVKHLTLIEDDQVAQHLGNQELIWSR